MPGRPRSAAGGENFARFDSNATGLWHSVSRRRLGVTTAAAQWREQPDPPATGRDFSSPPSVRRGWNCASVTHGFISVGHSYIAAACCVALVVVVARLPRCRDGAFISVACAASTHICGSPSSSLLLPGSLLFNAIHRPWRLHPRRRNRGQTGQLKNIPTAARCSAPPCRRRRRAVKKNARWEDKHKDAKTNCPGLL